jgi:hypothetical protein
MRRLQDLGDVEMIVHLVDERLKVGGQAFGQGWDRGRLRWGRHKKSPVSRACQDRPG